MSTARLARIVAIALWIAMPIAALAQPAIPLHIRLGSWNIEHLGNPGARRGSGEGVLQEPRDLAKYLRHAGVDLLAVQEVTADEPGPTEFPRQYRCNAILSRSLKELSRGPGQEWKHILFPKMRSGDTSQWTGIAWNAARVKPVGEIFQMPVSHSRSSQDSNRWDRNLHAMMFTTGKGTTDFVVLVLHLKANLSTSFAKHRGEEIEEFIRCLPALHKAFPGEKDFVLLGDTNILNAEEPAVRKLEDAGFRDLNKADVDTHTAKGTQPFDRVFVPKNQPEFARSTLDVLSAFQRRENLSFADFRARFSDHYIVVTPILTLPDDD